MGTGTARQVLAKEDETLRRFEVPPGRKGAAAPGGNDGVLRPTWRVELSSVWIAAARLVEVGAAPLKQGEEIKGDGAVVVVVTVSAPRANAGLISRASDAPTATVATELAAAVAEVKSPFGRTTVGGSDACVFRGFLVERPGSEEEAFPPFCLLLFMMT